MRKNTFIKKFMDFRYFELPKSFFKSKFYSFKFGYLNTHLEYSNPYVIICNKTTIFDKYLLSNTLKCDFVFLKDDIVKSIYNGTLSNEDRSELLNSFKILKESFISVVIFPEHHQSVFGNTDKISIEMTNFLASLKFNLKFVNLVGTYHVYPVWANDIRRANHTKFQQQFSIYYKDVENMSSEEFNQKINSNMPSSASIYTKKYPIIIDSRIKAQNLENIIYCCPKCYSFFSLYSEYNCLKCRECLTAIEISKDTTITISNNHVSLEDFASNQLEKLENFGFKKGQPILTYKDIQFCIKNYKNKIKELGSMEVVLFPHKITLNKNSYNKEIKFQDITEIELTQHNTIIIKTIDNEIILKGKNRENLYIIIDLHYLINKKLV